MSDGPVRIEVAVSAITVPANRLRPLDDPRVNRIADSIKEVGLNHPLGVFKSGDQWTLISGEHRLAAAKLLGHTRVPVIDLTEMSEQRRALWEVDENLARMELNSEEKRRHLERRKAIWETQPTGINSGQTVPLLPRKAGRPKGFARLTADAGVGGSKRTINRTLAGPKPVKVMATLEPEIPATPIKASFTIISTEKEKATAQRAINTYLTHDDQLTLIARGRAEARGEWAAERQGLLNQIDSLKKQLAALTAKPKKIKAVKAASATVENGVEAAESDRLHQMAAAEHKANGGSAGTAPP